MNLNDEQRESVRQYIMDKAPTTAGIACSVCGSRHWEISPMIFQIPEFQSKYVKFGGPRIPVVSMMCTNCSNTLFFNAIKLEVVPTDKEEGVSND